MTDTPVKLPELPPGEEVWSDHEQTGRGKPVVLYRSYSAADMRAYATAAVLASHPKLLEIAEKAQAVVDSDGGKFMDFLANVADLRTALKGLRGEGEG